MFGDAFLEACETLIDEEPVALFRFRDRHFALTIVHRSSSEGEGYIRQSYWHLRGYGWDTVTREFLLRADEAIE